MNAAGSLVVGYKNVHRLDEMENGDQGRAARPYETYAAVRIFAGTGSLTRVSDPRNHCSDA
jgi:hypothetical protein